MAATQPRPGSTACYEVNQGPTRSAAQVVTDRFASPEQAPLEQRYSARCAVLNNYCGGTFRGLRDRLDYIRGLNLDAVWPSPVGFQAHGGYHG